MNEGSWSRVWDLFHQALELPSADRARFLREECVDERELRVEVEELLASHERTDESFLRPVDFNEFELGLSIGHFVPYTVLGEGGMGTVYAARQTEPVRRDVALKVIRAGAYSREFLERFDRERQVLALMDHPNIARAYEAGETEGGRSYVAMELVAGEPIDRFCDQRRLDFEDRLSILAVVCRAVQHAHQVGVVHRDLKPSNILVSMREGSPDPRIIDFGIAKGIAPEGVSQLAGVEQEFQTVVGQVVGTPEYMSPEQADGAPDLDSRTDVYSLGAVLYRVMTGEHAQATESLRGLSLSELRSRLRTPPARPSQRYATLDEELAHERASARGTTAANLRRRLRGELDWIVTRAMAVDRTERYATASELAADIERLRGGLPVLAGPASNWYRFRKLVARHKVRATLLALAAVLLIAFTVALWRQKVQLDHALAEATIARSRAESTTDFLVDIFRISDPASGQGATITAREILDRAAQQLPGDLEEIPAVRSQLTATIGEIYRNLGLYSESTSLFDQVLQDAESLSPADRVEVMNRAASTHRLVGHYEDAEALLRQAESAAQALGAGHPAAAETLHQLGAVYHRTGRLDEAKIAYREALGVRRQAHAGDHLETAATLHNFGSLLWQTVEFEEAESLLREALGMRRRLLTSDHGDVAATLHNLGLVMDAQGDLAQAEELTRRALEIWLPLLGPDHLRVGSAYNNLAMLTFRLGDPRQSLELFRQAEQSVSAGPGPHHPVALTARHNQGEVLIALGEIEEAEQALRAVLDLRREILTPGHPELAPTLSQLGQLLVSHGRPEEAERLLAEAIAIREDKQPEGRIPIAEDRLHLASCWDRLGRLEEARALLEETFLELRTAGHSEAPVTGQISQWLKARSVLKPESLAP